MDCFFRPIITQTIGSHAKKINNNNGTLNSKSAYEKQRARSLSLYHRTSVYYHMRYIKCTENGKNIDCDFMQTQLSRPPFLFFSRSLFERVLCCSFFAFSSLLGFLCLFILSAAEYLFSFMRAFHVSFIVAFIGYSQLIYLCFLFTSPASLVVSLSLTLALPPRLVLFLSYTLILSTPWSSVCLSRWLFS